MFYHYSQNNSGGSFAFDAVAGVTHHVVIEADDADQANDRARLIGLYFDGAGDCSCCGERWYEGWGEGDAEPMVYGKPAADIENDWMDGPEVFVHYADGRVEGFGHPVKASA